MYVNSENVCWYLKDFIIVSIPFSKYQRNFLIFISVIWKLIIFKSIGYQHYVLQQIEVCEIFKKEMPRSL